MDGRTYPGDGRDGEHLEHGRGQVPEALEEVDERGARAAGGGLDVVLAKLLLAGDGQGDRHADDNEDLTEKREHEIRTPRSKRDEDEAAIVVRRGRRTRCSGLTTAVKKAPLRFAQASQHAAVLSHGSHLTNQAASRTTHISQ